VAEGEVVDSGELLVDPLDEVVLDGGHRQRLRRGIARRDHSLVLLATLK